MRNDGSSGLELGEAEVETEDIGAEIKDPYDPLEIRIAHKQPPIKALATRVAEGELDLSPSFQRRGGIWSERTQSRLVESVLLRIPLPAFYFDATNAERWLVVDGLQRMTALCRYILTDEELSRLKLSRLELSGLEFLKDVEGVSYSKLNRRHRRTIEEAQVSAYLIEPGTPDLVKFNVFKRINTGGLPLSAQEIRHALNQGPAAVLLETLATSSEFKKVTDEGISGTRMADRECVLRFIAFVREAPEYYQLRDFDYFLNEVMASVNTLSEQERSALATRFLRSMNAAYRIFGTDAFRKRYRVEDRRMPINKALFEAWAVNLDTLSDEDLERLVVRSEDVRAKFISLMNRPNREFELAISQGTGDIKKVRQRFKDLADLLEEVLQ